MATLRSQAAVIFALLAGVFALGAGAAAYYMVLGRRPALGIGLLLLTMLYAYAVGTLWLVLLARGMARSRNSFRTDYAKTFFNAKALSKVGVPYAVLAAAAAAVPMILVRGYRSMA